MSGRAGPAAPRETADTTTQKSGFTAITESEDAETQEAAIPRSRESMNTEMPPPPESMARLTVDLPESVHLRFKIACARSRRKMVQELREFIEQRTVELEAQSG